ncbi:BON domain-containing protein [Alienimonas chondri]|uniref:BON domain-containing protein n=1 Tax=Alienimonas chondri TaxID=2681879 RepID=A0ABX1VIJ3_9PLAN|nr:BON domain-containing protein [Alienimonas chondri]NNJ27939.1 hypothetical protein [Alienimonas chondri]
MRTHRKAGRQAAALPKGSYKKWVAALGIAAAAPCAAPAFADGPVEPAATQSAADVHANQQTADAVAGALRGSGLRGEGVEIVVREGACRLTGTVESPAMKRLATQAASKVAGVSSVDNAMLIAPPAKLAPSVAPTAAPMLDANVTPIAAVEDAAPVSNQAVAQQIAIAVQQAGLAGYDMEIRYKDGTCTLGGQVADASQINAAVSAARGVSGVSSVNNNLTVGQPVARTASAPQGPPSREEIARYRAMMQQRAAMSGQIPPGAYQQVVRPASSQQVMPGGPGCPPGANPAGPPAMGAGAVYNQANLPDYAWPTYAQHPNYAAVTYPKDYSASAWPYIGPFYPYPQVPLGWREVELEWDDGQWYLDFNDRTDRWWWFMSPDNW